MDGTSAHWGAAGHPRPAAYAARRAAAPDPPPARHQACEGPAIAAQLDLIRGLYADRVIPWPARTSREAFLMERATVSSGQFLTPQDAGQIIDWLLTLPHR